MPVILGAAADAHSLDDQSLGLLGSTLLGGWLFATVVAFYRLPAVSRHLALAVGAGLAASGFVVSLLTGHLWGLYAAWAIAGMGAAIVYCVSIQTIAELGYVERAFGLKVSAEVISGALLLFAFPALLIASWGFPGSMYGIAAVYLLAVVLEQETELQPTETPEQRCNRFDDASQATVQDWRDTRAANWKRARKTLRALTAEQQAQVDRRFTQNRFMPGDPVYLLEIIRSVLKGHHEPATRF